MVVDEATMRALPLLPTLTALDPRSIAPGAWPLLPQLPRLRQLSFGPYELLTPELLLSLCDTLSCCSALTDLALRYVCFRSADGWSLCAEQQGVRWAALLSSVPNLRRLGVYVDVTDLLPVLPLHLPLLEHLVLRSKGDADLHNFAALSHPNIRLLEFRRCSRWVSAPSNERMRLCMHSEQLPKLERCVFSAGPED